MRDILPARSETSRGRIMIDALHVLMGLAGTGKTYFILSKMQKMIDEGNRCIYLTFNKALQVSTSKKLKGVTSEVFTFHGLCYQALKSIGQGDEFDALMTKSGEIDRTQSYGLLISRFIAVFSKDGATLPMYGIDAVFIDEFQNVPSNLVPVVSLLAKKLDAVFYVCGDPIQAIAHWASDDPRHFENLNAIFGVEPKYLTPLRMNHRAKAGPLRTVNSFLKAQFPQWSASLSYSIPYEVNKNDERTKVYIVTSPEREGVLVIDRIKEILRNGNPSIAILARNRKQLEIVQTVLAKSGLDEKGVRISTIHSYIGSEADIVFLVGLEVPSHGDYRMKNKTRDEAPGEARVLYVGLSRAREQLIIMSPSPRTDLEALLGDGVEIVDMRESTEWEKRPFPMISSSRQEQYLTKKKYDLSTIDSIAVKVDVSDVPWLPYITDKMPPSKWERQTCFAIDGVPVFVKRNLSHGFYLFRLSDTNALKRSGFTDRDILNFLRYAIFRFFNTEFPIERAKVVRIDLCRLYDKDDITIGRIRNALACYPKVPVGNDGRIIERLRASDKNTWYYHVRAHYGFQVVFYGPSNKTNGNRLYNEDLYKIEVRLQGGCIGKRGYSDGLSTFGDLIEQLSTTPNLGNWYWKALLYAGFDNPQARRYKPPKSEWFFLEPGDKYSDDVDLMA